MLILYKVLHETLSFKKHFIECFLQIVLLLLRHSDLIFMFIHCAKVGILIMIHENKSCSYFPMALLNHSLMA